MNTYERFLSNEPILRRKSDCHQELSQQSTKTMQKSKRKRKITSNVKAKRTKETEFKMAATQNQYGVKMAAKMIGLTNCMCSAICLQYEKKPSSVSFDITR